MGAFISLLSRSRAFEFVYVAVLYLLLGWAGLVSALLPRVATVVWPASGLAIAYLLLRGLRNWPGILIGALAVELATLHRVIPDLSTSKLLLISIVLAVGSTAQAVLGAYLIQRFIGLTTLFRRATNVLTYASFEMIACIIAPTVGAVTLCAFQISEWEAFQETWITWWLGDLVGALTVGSLILLWSDKQARPIVSWKSVIEMALQAVGVMIVSQFIFGVPFVGQTPNFERAYILLPILIWVLYRSGQAEGMTAIFMASTFSVWGTMNGLGPFAGETLFESLLSVQTYVGVVTIMSLTLGAALADRKIADEEKTRLLKIEQALRKELSSSNEQLSRFAHVASHDLTEPLRMVSLYLSLLEKACPDSLNEDAKQYIRFAVDGASRMKRLLESLVAYSEMSSQSMKPVQVWLNSILNEVLNNLKISIEEKNAIITNDPLPRVCVDPILMSQLLQNIISNALKYHKPEVPPRIHLAAVRGESEWIIQVQDDGIGINMKHSDRIFQVFQRLHPVDEFAGAGLGLSICRTIAERHQGKIWVESTEGNGATFFVAIPDKIDTTKIPFLQKEYRAYALGKYQAIKAEEVGSKFGPQTHIH